MFSEYCSSCPLLYSVLKYLYVHNVTVSYVVGCCVNFAVMLIGKHHHHYLLQWSAVVLFVWCQYHISSSYRHGNKILFPLHSTSTGMVVSLSSGTAIDDLSAGSYCYDIVDYGRYEIARHRHLDGLACSTPTNNNRLHSSITTAATSSSMDTAITPVVADEDYGSSEFLIEFRGLNPAFRYDEFVDAYQLVLKQQQQQQQPSSSTCIDSLMEETKMKLMPEIKEKLRFTEVIPDTLSEYPIGAYVTLPSSRVASLIASRCAMVRRVIQVWADGSTMLDVCDQALANYPSLISPMLRQHEMDRSSSNNNNGTHHRTWWVHFERYGRSGRSGLDTEGKRLLLSRFHPLFQLIQGSATSSAPIHELIYLEDWHSYQKGLNALIAARKASGSVATSEDLLQYAASYSPHRCVWGRILAVGPSIVNHFDLRRRPFVGN